MKLIDMHCDTISKLLELKGKEDLYNNSCDISVPRMKQGKTLAQFFACFTCFEDYGDEGGYDGAYDHALRMMKCLKEQTEKYSDDIAMAYSYEDLKKNEAAGKISAILTVEEGGIINGEMKRLEELYNQGVRLMTLMWNYENCLGYPNSRDESIMWQGLKPFGREVVERMNKLGMIIDVSHASDGTFRDVLGLAKVPVVASHSNCRALCNHPRNLTDDMIRQLANIGGIAGVNFYGAFLGTQDQSLISEMKAHILHMIDVGGSEFPAIGTDFDGFDGMTHLDIPDASQMEKLWEELRKGGISETQLEKIWNGNARRILQSL